METEEAPIYEITEYRKHLQKIEVTNDKKYLETLYEADAYVSSDDIGDLTLYRVPHRTEGSTSTK